MEYTTRDIDLLQSRGITWGAREEHENNKSSGPRGSYLFNPILVIYQHVNEVVLKRSIKFMTSNTHDGIVCVIISISHDLGPVGYGPKRRRFPGHGTEGKTLESGPSSFSSRKVNFDFDIEFWLLAKRQDLCQEWTRQTLACPLRLMSRPGKNSCYGCLECE